ncbi:MAG: pyrroloquinoline quinone biosynthesis protein PqqB [Vulcanimicrobiaceae bacterium]
MIVRVLGSAAGGGVPQWNCGCPNCSAARAGTRPRRTQSSFALSADGERWWLINVSPDVAAQIESYAPLQPRGLRGTPIAGMLLTDANVDHLGGLAVLRQMGDHAFRLYSSATVRAIAHGQPAFAPFLEAPHQWHGVAPGGSFELDAGLSVDAISVVGLTPGYDGRRAVADAVLAFAVEDRATGGRVVFAPVFAACGEPLRTALERAAIAFLDGSFWSEAELGNVGVGKSSQALGHLPIAGPGGSLAALAPLSPRTRLYYAHLNNTNPVLDPASPEARELAGLGCAVAADALQFEL